MMSKSVNLWKSGDLLKGERKSKWLMLNRLNGDTMTMVGFKEKGRTYYIEFFHYYRSAVLQADAETSSA